MVKLSKIPRTDRPSDTYRIYIPAKIIEQSNLEAGDELTINTTQGGNLHIGKQQPTEEEQEVIVQ